MYHSNNKSKSDILHYIFINHTARRVTLYLKTRSDAWLDLELSQEWCFSWTFAIFSAAAMGHPERLQQQQSNLCGVNITLRAACKGTRTHTHSQTHTHALADSRSWTKWDMRECIIPAYGDKSVRENSPLFMTFFEYRLSTCLQNPGMRVCGTWGYLCMNYAFHVA